MNANKKQLLSDPLTETEWSAEKQAMETLDASLTGRRTLVMDVRGTWLYVKRFRDPHCEGTCHVSTFFQERGCCVPFRGERA